MSDDNRILAEDVTYAYEEADKNAVNHLSLEIREGEFVAVLGHNGSGKSTFAKLLNALYLPSSGRVLVYGMDTADDEQLWNIRQKAGMIFQNPDNQIVATVVREDVAFGLENLGVEHDEMVRRIDEALESVHMTKYAEKEPHMLSGGQKQRIAIAGVLAMEPSCLIADEATAMLDPKGRKKVLDTVRRLNKEKGITVVWITHYMEEVTEADRVVVVSDGETAMIGTPREVFSKVEKMRELHLDVPRMTALAQDLREDGLPLRDDILTVEEMAEEVARLLCP
ncbi:MAG: energy-coupling factor transporter ATPase [Clostridia bacterium]|nr:energy-coupling factor transporter ATPase [Clostridia bacterium]